MSEVSKSWNRMETWLTLMVVGIGLLLLGISGLWMYMSATATPLHPDAQTAPSVSDRDPSATWGGAVERGRQAVRARLAERNLPGLSVAVGIDGDIVWAEGFGWADLEHRVAVDPATRFRIGTASVMLTSAAVGLLLEQGRLSLDEEIRTYVPEFPSKDWPVTLRQLMAHTAGVRTDGGDEGALFSQRCERPVDALPHFAGRSLLFEPGTQFRYSSYGWILVSAAVEAAAKEPFLTFMQEEIFEPLGMQHTTADSDRIIDSDRDEDPPVALIPGRATSYFPRFAAEPRYGPDLMRPLNYSCYAGASVLLSTPADLVRFVTAMNSGTLLKPETVERLRSPQRVSSGQETGYGLGWDLEAVTLSGQQLRLAGHNGDVLGGQAASVLTFPEHRIVVAVTSNISYAETFSLALQIAEAFAEQPQKLTFAAN